MRKIARKYETMYIEYGKDPEHDCGQCSNFVRAEYHGRILQKCKGYGLTHSEATDWRQFWCACGMFNKSFDGRKPMIECLSRSYIDNSPIDGQLSL